MCLTKKEKNPIEATEDMYVLKWGQVAKEESFFTAAMGFTYKKGVIYRKRWVSKLRAKIAETLNGEVYHTFSVDYSYGLVRSGMKLHLLDYGVFKIPKGTKYYEGKNMDLGTLSIEYIGNSIEAISILKNYLRSQ